MDQASGWIGSGLTRRSGCRCAGKYVHRGQHAFRDVSGEGGGVESSGVGRTVSHRRPRLGVRSAGTDVRVVHRCRSTQCECTVQHLDGHSSQKHRRRRDVLGADAAEFRGAGPRDQSVKRSDSLCGNFDQGTLNFTFPPLVSVVMQIDGASSQNGIALSIGQ